MDHVAPHVINLLFFKWLPFRLEFKYTPKVPLYSIYLAETWISPIKVKPPLIEKNEGVIESVRY